MPNENEENTPAKDVSNSIQAFEELVKRERIAKGRVDEYWLKHYDREAYM